MPSNIQVPTLRQLVSLGSEAWEAVREAISIAKTEIEALQEAIGAAVGGATIVATTADLPEGEVTDGVTYYVTSQRALYQGMNGVLVRTQTSPSWATVTTWYISSTGSVDASGASSDVPTTYDELLARIGTTKITAGITVYVLDDLNLPELIYFGDTEADGDHWLYFEGVPTVAATGTIASVTNWDATTNQDGVITGSSSLVAHVGKLLRITSGDRAGAQFWIAHNTTGSTVRISQPLASAWTTDRADPLQVGDAYEVLTLPYLADSVSVQAGRDVEFGYLRIGTSSSPHTINIMCGGTTKMNGCDLHGFDVDVGSEATLYGCRLQSGMRAQGKASIYAFACMSDGATARSGGKLEIADHLSQSDRIRVEPGGELRNAVAGAWLAVYDYSSVAGLVFYETSQTYFDGYVIGKGVTTTGARIQVLDAAVVALGHTPVIAGSGTELQVGGKENGTGGTKLTFADVPWTHGGSAARIFVLGAAAHPTPRTSQEFASYLDGNALLGATSTTTGTATHNLTLGGSHARSIQVRLASSSNAYTGSWTVTGQDINGSAQTETLSTADPTGDASPILETKKTYKPGSVTVTRTAMANTSGSYTVNVGNAFGFSLKAYEGPTIGLGHLLSMTIQDFGQASLATSFAYVNGPTLSPPYGSLVFVATSLSDMAGASFQACYLAVQ